MTDANDFRRVKDTDALAKRLGFKLESINGTLYLYAGKKTFPALFYDDDKRVFAAQDIVEIRGFLMGFKDFLNAIKRIDFDEDEYKKRQEDQKVLDILKGKI
jgi:hypothetical protein